MGLFRRRPRRQEYAVSAEALWGALKAGLPSVTDQATFYEESHRVEWIMDLSAFDWPQRMSARVEASRDGGAVVTVEGKSAYGTGAKSIAGPGRRRKAAAALLAAVSSVVSQSGGAAARPPTDDDGFRYWTGREWTPEPPPPAPPGPRWRLVRRYHDHVEGGPGRGARSEGRRKAEVVPSVGKRQLVSVLRDGGGIVE